MGPNSIGWALLDENEGRIVAMGVRVFPEGVNRDQNENEQPKNQTRREKRGQRRQIARRAKRKRRMIALLQSYEWLPIESAEWDNLLLEDPYELRAKGLKEQLSIHQLSRAILHLNQRRGFLSNRKSDKEKKKETSDMLKEISELETRIQESGSKTLGQYLAGLKKEERMRVRGRHTRREMYEKEFDLLWEVQKTYHAGELTDERYREVRKTLFFQRAVYWPESSIGRCSLEPSFKRCPRADRLAQRFRIVQEVNNLRLIDSGTGDVRPLNAEERKIVIDKLSQSEKRTFDQFRSDLGLLESCKFNFEDAKRSKLKGHETDARLSGKKYLGKTWFELPDSIKDEIVNWILDDRIGEKEFIEKAVGDWEFNEETANRLMEVNLPDGYMSFSRKAIEKMLPFLEEGLPLMSDDNSPSAMSQAGYLRPDQRPVKILNSLPKPPNLTNPIVRQTLFEFRKLINVIIREYGKPNRIHIELARDVKNPKNVRERILQEQYDRRKRREKAKEEIEKIGEKATGEKIDKYLLWEEQDHRCVYSGKNIGISQLFGGEIEVDHILPYSRTLDNSMQNKAVCFRSANQDKGDQTPYEWLAAQHPQKFDELQQHILSLHWKKRRKFTQKSVELDDFIERQLKDTQYISREVASYLRCLDVEVVCTKGQNTADLRRVWGLDSVLNREGLDIKNRDDHRHHAVDAIVIALTNHFRLQQLARSRIRTVGQIEMSHPWNHFWEDVRDAVNAINVSHRVQRKIHGALHEETIYGPTEKEGVFVYRKPIEALTLSMIEKIRDEGIRRIVEERLRQFGLEAGRGKGSIPKETWKEPLLMPSGVPIKKVRLLREDASVIPLRGNAAYVKPGNLHHLCLFELENGTRDIVCVPMLEAIRRIKNKESVIQRTHPEYPDAKFLMSMSSNELFLIEHQGTEDLYRFETAASTQKWMKFRHHTFAGKNSDTQGQISKMPNTLRAKKVTVDRLGRLRWAND